MKLNCVNRMINMRRNLFIFSVLSGIWLVLTYCSQNSPAVTSSENAQQRDLVPVNKYLVKKSEQNIINYIQRKGWDMKETQTGLWYMIYEHGKGKPGEKGKVISFLYELSLLDGQKCYSSDSLGIKSFRIGSGHVESGLEEAALILHEGDKARIIMPPHLAWGILGDNNKIPGQASILYELTVVEVK
jgi:FKBP-type peptidyl-prolyl cis-trans isomerase FkpA